MSTLPLTDDVPINLVVTRDDALRICDVIKGIVTREAHREQVANPATGPSGNDLRMLKYDECHATLRALQLVLRTMDRRTVLVQGEPEAVSP